MPGLTTFLERLQRRWASFLATRLDTRWRDPEYVARHVFTAGLGYLDQHRHVQQVEYQLGRYLQMREVCREIAERGVEGDVVEFGTWQGLGLALLSHALAEDARPRKLVGIDSFEGLPESSTVWQKGNFSDTSLALARDNIERWRKANPLHSVELIQGWFGEPAVGAELRRSCRDIALVHFDADLGSSTTQALSMVEPYLAGRVKPIYFLFDDWGVHPDEVPDAFHGWLEAAKSRHGLRAQKISSTRFTRYYRLTFA